MRLDELRPGVLLHVDGAASVQFGSDRAIVFRLIGYTGSGYDGWIWAAGYQLNAAGDAVERRDLFVQYAGLRPAKPSTSQRTREAPTTSANPPRRAPARNRPPTAAPIRPMWLTVHRRAAETQPSHG